MSAFPIFLIGYPADATQAPLIREFPAGSDKVQEAQKRAVATGRFVRVILATAFQVATPPPQ